MNIDELQYEQDTDPHYCPVCDSGDSSVLGKLGNRVHLRCRCCGIDFSFVPATGARATDWAQI